MEVQESPHVVSVSPFKKVIDAFLLFLFFEASQGMTLFQLPRHFLTAEALHKHPWIGVYEGHLWKLVVREPPRGAMSIAPPAGGKPRGQAEIALRATACDAPGSSVESGSPVVQN